MKYHRFVHNVGYYFLNFSRTLPSNGNIPLMLGIYGFDRIAMKLVQRINGLFCLYFVTNFSVIIIFIRIVVNLNQVIHPFIFGTQCLFSRLWQMI